MKGGLGLIGQSPSTAWRSVWQTPVDSIFTRIWSAWGSGTGRSSITSGLPNSRTTAAFMVFACLIKFLCLLGLCGCSPRLEEAQFLRAIADQHVLGLLIMIEHHLVVLPPDTGLFVAAESGVRGIQVVAIHPNSACLDTPSEAMAAVRVSAPNTRAQAIERIVSDGERLALIAERRYGEHRSEDLFLEDAHFVVAAEDGGLDI